MKYYRILFLAAALTGLSSCAVDPLKEYEVEKPQSIAQYEYLNEYDVLKNYVDRSASPDFKLGAALAASDFTAHGQVYALAVSNFDEMTAGNDMKYASIVANDGSMSFDNVRNFINAADEAGMTVYGHTLAWHAQQNNKYLNGIIADKELDIDPNMKLEVEVTNHNYPTDGPFPYYVMGCAPPIINGALHFEPTGEWSQFFVLPGANNPLTPGDYVVYLEMTSDKDASGVQLTMQNGWGSSDQNVTAQVAVTAGAQVYRLNFPAIVGGNYDMILKPQTADAVLDVKSIKVCRLEAPAVEAEILAYEVDYSKSAYTFWNQINDEVAATSSIAKNDAAGALEIKSTVAASQNYFVQYHIADGLPTEADKKYKLKVTMKGTSEGTLSIGVGPWSGRAEGSIKFNTEWKTYEFPFTAVADGGHVMAQSGVYVGTIQIKSVELYKIESLTSIPLTPEEKKDTLTWAMDNWIKGMMEVTASKVSAWDVVNEPISGADKDGDGKYDLQSGATGDPANNFYWQDYLGNEDYVRIVVGKARKYYAEFGGTAPLKLFINEYNLESDWDDNKKLKSLIEWIKVWEADGETKIDGIGTQMHVSCYEDANTQKSKEDHVVAMFNLLKESGKLVKISELDMGYVDKDGNTVPTTAMTEAQHQAMAAYYKFIVSKYFEIIPAAQQYGITQWCVTDASGELGSGWRGGEPVGLWDLSYNRKHTYAGFADGLSGK